jgi:hypothetical protein
MTNDRLEHGLGVLVSAAVGLAACNGATQITGCRQLEDRPSFATHEGGGSPFGDGAFTQKKMNTRRRIR